MAGGARELKKRIKVVKNTQQITNAMKMVAAAKLKVAQTRMEATGPYTDKMQEILNNLLLAAADLSHPLTGKQIEAKRIALVLYTSDRGLCGSFNSNMIRKARTYIADTEKGGKKVALFTIGRRGNAYFSKRDYDVVADYSGINPSMTFQEAKELSSRIKEIYTGRDFDAVYLCYPKFKNMVTSIPTVFQFLPLVPETAVAENAAQADYIFEPDVEHLFNSLIPRYVDMQFFRLLIESMTSQFAAQMTAMTAATDNAEEVVRSLTITYNKVRQSAITSELLDIVGGVNALEG